MGAEELLCLRPAGSGDKQLLLYSERSLHTDPAACAALFATALAVSPGLREQLSGLLGGYAAYTQPVEDAACVVDGIELRVLSAMADSATVKVYAQVRDLTGQDRLSPDLEVSCVIQRAEEAKEGHEGASTTHGGKCVAFDETTGTALLDQLAEVSGMPAPQPLATLKDKQVRFTSWTEKEQMRAVVTDFLK